MHLQQMAFQETADYKENIKHSYKIEAKNIELNTEELNPSKSFAVH
jgi:hypothetical protein